MGKITTEQTLNAIEERLRKVRTNLRQEYLDSLGESFKNMPEEEFKTKIFDYDRAPFIEKKGMDQAKVILYTVPVRDFPDTQVFLLTVLNRLEHHFYDLTHPAKKDQADQRERRNLMYKTGVRKVMSAVAEFLEEGNARIWKFRRRMLDALESRLWKHELGLAVMSGHVALDTGELAETLLSFSPAEIAAMAGPADLGARFRASCGSKAGELCDNFADKQ